ncbi:hypothetical protein N7462_001394 [Penicillium macrosclerotiorum]|uniref:uncharacterized protein n=1 Tax=Penicillium macrosclerotiorum TaxID=303699 RepID=UPI00254810DD|nr:uncharacterized protein N7462_001394 [Penicillium macrosclerotiorum]KAJ5691971.1 hypothetical protein N7462_001394 [Penicillium macrosclerotiorum]
MQAPWLGGAYKPCVMQMVFHRRPVTIARVRRRTQMPSRGISKFRPRDVHFTRKLQTTAITKQHGLDQLRFKQPSPAE